MIPCAPAKAIQSKRAGCALVCLMVVVPIPWALPFLSVLAPSERYHQTRGVRHKTVLDWARQLLMLLRRWLPDRQRDATTVGGMVRVLENGGLSAAGGRGGGQRGAGAGGRPGLATRVIGSLLGAPAPRSGRGATPSGTEARPACASRDSCRRMPSLCSVLPRLLMQRPSSVTAVLRPTCAGWSAHPWLKAMDRAVDTAPGHRAAARCDQAASVGWSWRL